MADLKTSKSWSSARLDRAYEAGRRLTFDGRFEDAVGLAREVVRVDPDADRAAKGV